MIISYTYKSRLTLVKKFQAVHKPALKGLPRSHTDDWLTVTFSLGGFAL